MASPFDLIRRGHAPAGSAVHFVMTLGEHVAARGGYVDPDRYREGHRDYSPEMLCRGGNYHAFGTRDRAAVTCTKCRERVAALPLLTAI